MTATATVETKTAKPAPAVEDRPKVMASNWVIADPAMTEGRAVIVTVPDSWTHDDVLHPDAWSNAKPLLRDWDHMLITNRSHTWYARWVMFDVARWDYEVEKYKSNRKVDNAAAVVIKSSNPANGIMKGAANTWTPIRLSDRQPIGPADVMSEREALHFAQTYKVAKK